MFEFLMDFVINVFETIAGLILILSIYMIPIRAFTPQIIFTSIVMAQTSYLLRSVFHLEAATPFFMLAWIVVLLWMLFRIHIFYSLLMAVTGYLAYIVIQMTIVFLLQIVFTMDTIFSEFLYLKLIQIASSIVAISVARFFVVKRIGLSFVPDRITEKVPVQGINRKLLFILIISSIWISVMVSFLTKGWGPFIISIISMILIVNIVVHLLIAKERGM